MSVLITGGSKGIGKACAKRFVDAGHEVHVTYAGDSAAADACAAEIGCTVHRCDQGDAASIEALWHEIGTDVDVLILNAAYQKKLGFAETPRSVLEQTFAVNILGSVDFLQRFAQSRGDQGGSVVIHSSNQAELVNPTGFAYALSKAALNHLVRHAARALVDQGIRVNGVILGWFDTEGERAFYSKEQIAEQAAVGIPMKRAGDPAEAAALSYFLATDASSYMTGSLVRNDGGFALAPDLST